MADIGGFVKEVLGVGVVVSSLLGIAAFLGRSQIAHWLNKDIERIKSQLQRELEAEKASHLQALEAYKVALIAEAERAKAAQAVKTAVAVKFSEHQFTAISAMNRAMSGIAPAVLTMYAHATHEDATSDVYNWGEFDSSLAKFQAGHLNLKEAIYSCRLFMKNDEVAFLLHLENILVGVTAVSVSMRENFGRLPGEFKKGALAAEFTEFADPQDRVAFMARIEEKVNVLLREYVKRLHEMQNN